MQSVLALFARHGYEDTSIEDIARQDIDRAMLAWEISLLFLRLTEIPLADPAPLVTSLTDLIYHALFTDAIQ